MITIVFFLLCTKKIKEVLVTGVYLVSGFLIGAFPLWIYNALYHGATFTADIRPRVTVIMHFDKLKKLLCTDIPASFHFLDIGILKAQFLSYMLCGLLLMTLLVHIITIWKDARTHKTVKNSLPFFLCLFLTVFLFITAFTSVPVTTESVPTGWDSMNPHAEYYLILLQPLLFALLLLLKNGKKILIKSCACVICIIGMAGLTASYGFNEQILHRVKGTEGNAYECGANFITNMNLFLDFYQKVPADLKEHYVYGAGVTMNYYIWEGKEKEAQDIFNTIAVSLNMPPELWRRMLIGAIEGETGKDPCVSYLTLASILKGEPKEILRELGSNYQ